MSYWRRMFHADEWFCGVNSEQQRAGGQTESRKTSVAANGAFVVVGCVCERCRVRILVVLPLRYVHFSLGPGKDFRLPLGVIQKVDNTKVRDGVWRQCL